MAEGYVISPLTVEMLAACADIAATAPDPWTVDGLERAQADLNHWNYAALLGSVPVGFACFLAVGGSADLQMMAVHADHRKKGVAQALLAQAVADLGRFGITQCLLEVRQSNRAAVALYQKLGFKTLARRPGMYHNPPEDGFLMAKALAKPDPAK